jgi:pimeloyl-ACP methyl ester carboxylesterase
MRVAAERRRARWVIESRLLEGTQRQIRLSHGEWLDIVQVGSGEPVLMIPGLAGGWRLLAPLALRLVPRCQVTVCGLRGDRFPASGPWARDIADHAHDVIEVLGQLRLERPAVVGVSFGGAVALELACEYPQQVGALVVFGAGPQFHASLGSTIARRVLERFPLPSDNRFVNQFFNLLHGGKPDSATLAEFVIDRCWETDQCIMARRLGLLESFDVSERLWRVDAPALVVAGSRDVIVPPSQQKALASRISGASYEAVEGAGHVGFLTHRREFARAVVRHLRQVKHSAGS